MFPCILHCKRNFFRGLFCIKSYTGTGKKVLENKVSKTFYFKNFFSIGLPNSENFFQRTFLAVTGTATSGIIIKKTKINNVFLDIYCHNTSLNLWRFSELFPSLSQVCLHCSKRVRYTICEHLIWGLIVEFLRIQLLCI